jgi:hypothetical protein
MPKLMPEPKLGIKEASLLMPIIDQASNGHQDQASKHHQASKGLQIRHQTVIISGIKWLSDLASEGHQNGQHCQASKTHHIKHLMVIISGIKRSYQALKRHPMVIRSGIKRASNSHQIRRQKVIKWSSNSHQIRHQKGIRIGIKRSSYQA